MPGRPVSTGRALAPARDAQLDAAAQRAAGHLEGPVGGRARAAVGHDRQRAALATSSAPGEAAHTMKMPSSRDERDELAERRLDGRLVGEDVGVVELDRRQDDGRGR